MKFFYLVFIGAGFCAIAFVAGMRMESANCTARTATSHTKSVTHFIELKEQVNAQTLHHHTDDIRRILREKYTIAD